MLMKDKSDRAASAKGRLPPKKTVTHGSTEPKAAKSDEEKKEREKERAERQAKKLEIQKQQLQRQHEKEAKEKAHEGHKSGAGSSPATAASSKKKQPWEIADDILAREETKASFSFNPDDVVADEGKKRSKPQ